MLLLFAGEALRQTREKMPNASFQSVWIQCKKDNPSHFGDLQAADWEEDDKAEEENVVPHLVKVDNPGVLMSNPARGATASMADPQPNRFVGYHGEMRPKTSRPVEQEGKRLSLEEMQAIIQDRLAETRKKMPNASFDLVWNQCRKDNPKLFGKLEEEDNQPDNQDEPPSRQMDKSNWSSDYAEAPKAYPDVREQMQRNRDARESRDQLQSRLNRTEFTLDQHKAFFEQMRNGESFYVKVEG